MHITLESDYAVRIVSCLSTEEKRLDAKTISERTGVTLRFSLKILGKLVGAQIVRSFKGTQGGYELARKPEEITLREVIEVIEGPYHLSRCSDPSFDCPRGEYCRFVAVYDEISLLVKDKLEQVTFAVSQKHHA